MASINTIVKRKQYLWLGIVVVGAASAIGGALYTIKVGNCTISSTFHHHTGTDYRLTCFVKDSTRNGFALCKGPYSQYG